MAGFIFNGKQIIGSDKERFPSPYNASSGEKNHQTAHLQYEVGQLPIPEFTYTFKIEIAKELATVVPSNTIYTCELERHTSGLIEKMPKIAQLTSLGLKIQDKPKCELRLKEFGNMRVDFKNNVQLRYRNTKYL
jgi:hypothetical protein